MLRVEQWNQWLMVCFYQETALKKLLPSTYVVNFSHGHVMVFLFLSVHNISLSPLKSVMHRLLVSTSYPLPGEEHFRVQMMMHLQKSCGELWSCSEPMLLDESTVLR